MNLRILYAFEIFQLNILKCGNAFPRVMQKFTKFANSHDCIFHILRYFATKLHNFTKFRMLFPAVLMNFPDSKVCQLIGEWSIRWDNAIKTVCDLHRFWTSAIICGFSHTGLLTLFAGALSPDIYEAHWASQLT